MGASTACPRVKLALDHHYSSRITVGLRDLGHDVITVSERGWEAETDEDVLALCLGEQRAILTNNVVDFAVIVDVGRWKAGCTLGSSSPRQSVPRSSDWIGQYVITLDNLCNSCRGRTRPPTRFGGCDPSSPRKRSSVLNGAIAPPTPNKCSTSQRLAPIDPCSAEEFGRTARWRGRAGRRVQCLPAPPTFCGGGDPDWSSFGLVNSVTVPGSLTPWLTAHRLPATSKASPAAAAPPEREMSVAGAGTPC